MVTACVGSAIATAQVSVVDTVPLISSITASPATVTSTTTTLTANASDDGGLANLAYAWSQIGTTPAAVIFANTSTNSTLITFRQSGSYQLQVAVTDKNGNGSTAIKSTTITVNSTLTSIVVSPSMKTIHPGATQVFTAIGSDQFALPLAQSPTWSWTRSTGGTINASTGVFIAALSPGGPYTVTASGAGKSASATFYVGSVAPDAENQTLSISQGNNLPIVLTGKDANDDPITYEVVTQPGNGLLSGIAPNLTYSSNNGYVGIDSFTFKVNDGTFDSNPGTITIQVTDLNEVVQVGVSPLLKPVPFDSNKWSSDTAYQTAYLSQTDPSRIWLSCEPGLNVPILRIVGPRRIALVGNNTGTLTVAATANAPVSFFSYGQAGLGSTLTNAITVKAGATGNASVTIRTLTDPNRCRVLCASPMCSGSVAFDIDFK